MQNKKTKVHNYISIAITVVIILIISLGIYLYVESKKIEEESIYGQIPTEFGKFEFSNETTEYDPEFNFLIESCKYITTNFECIESDNNTFYKEQDIWLLINVKDLKAIEEDGKFLIKYSEERQIFDTNNNLIDSVSGTILDEEKETRFTDYFDIKLKNQLITSSTDQSGDYLIKIKIKDKNTGIKIGNSIKITLK
jgi:hypothetical protein